MESFLREFWSGMQGDFADLGNGLAVGRVFGRVLVAALLAGILGFERETKGKAAGLRTHMLVSVAAALFVIVSEQAGMPAPDISRVIQGIATGMGFIGAGAILKGNDDSQIQGLTTAASLWLTTAVGCAAGLGRESTAVLVTLLAIVILTVLPKFEQMFQKRNGNGHD